MVLMIDLREKIGAIAASAPAAMSVALRHLESGAEVMLDADRPVPLASVVKVPIMIEAFARIEAGELSLETRAPVEHRDKTIGSGILSYLDDGLAPTLRDLVTLMIIISDNTATDILFHRLGVKAINDRLRASGFTDIHVVRTLAEVFADMLPGHDDPDQDVEELRRVISAQGVRRDGFSFSPGSDNNVGTARSLCRLVAMLQRNEILSSDSCAAMLWIMAKQQMNDRIPRFLPPGTWVANKTGSFQGVRNDVGVIRCKEESHVAVAILSTWDADAVRQDTRKCREVWEKIDAAMGEIALAAFEEYG